MATLKEKLQAARQVGLQLGSHRITLRRPTPWEIAKAHASDQRMDVVWAAGFVIGWDFTEADVIPGGLPEPASFDGEVFALWIQDYPDHWPTLVNGVVAAYQDHERAQAERKNA